MEGVLHIELSFYGFVTVIFNFEMNCISAKSENSFDCLYYLKR